MKSKIVVIGSKSGKGRGGAEVLALEYVARIAKYVPCTLEAFPTEAKLLDHVEALRGRTRAVLVLAHSAGMALNSVDFAAEVRKIRDSGAQSVVFAVGPADGWSTDALHRADLLIAFGRMTLPHELAAVVLAEQVYRAMTILAGHPYHTGH